MFDPFDTFRLCLPLPGEAVPLGARGIVLDVLSGEPLRYEVEFPDGFGGTLGNSATYRLTVEFMQPDEFLASG